jgi:hypothetical protein
LTCVVGKIGPRGEAAPAAAGAARIDAGIDDYIAACGSCRPLVLVCARARRREEEGESEVDGRKKKGRTFSQTQFLIPL